MSALLEVRDLDKRYRTRHGVIHAVQGVSFDVREKETVALVGESGCGKSTVALSLLHLIEHDGGQVRFEGIEIDQLKGREEQALRRDLSIVFQNPYSSLNPRMRVKGIVGEPIRTAWRLKGREVIERVQRQPNAVGLGPEHLRRFPHEFSGGQRQRIAIARVPCPQYPTVQSAAPCTSERLSTLVAPLINEAKYSLAGLGCPVRGPTSINRPEDQTSLRRIERRNAPRESGHTQPLRRRHSPQRG